MVWQTLSSLSTVKASMNPFTSVRWLSSPWLAIYCLILVYRVNTMSRIQILETSISPNMDQLSGAVPFSVSSCGSNVEPGYSSWIKKSICATCPLWANSTRFHWPTTLYFSAFKIPGTVWHYLLSTHLQKRCHINPRPPIMH